MKFFKNNTKQLALTIVLLSLSVATTLFSYYGIDNFYTSTLLIFIASLAGIKFLNKLIIKLYKLIENNNRYFYLYVTLRAIRLPLISLLYILLLGFILTLIGAKAPITQSYAQSILSFINYFIIILLGWTLFRISQKIKEHKIQQFLTFNRSNDIDESIKNRNKYKTTNIDTGFKLLNFSILILTIIAVINEATGSVSGFLAIGGGLVIVFGLSARDFLSNFFGGFMIYINRPFEIGDLIKVTDQNIEGIVNEIGWTAVKIVTTDKRPLYIPNSSFSKQLIENSSKMNCKPIRESFKLKQNNIKGVSKACKKIKQMLEEHQGVDQENNIIVNINEINDNYIEVILVCFSKSIEISRYHSIKQNILMKTFDILNEFELQLQNTKESIIINQK